MVIQLMAQNLTITVFSSVDLKEYAVQGIRGKLLLRCFAF